MTETLIEQFTGKVWEMADVQLGEQSLARFHRYYEILVDWNERMNLTGITDLEGVYWKHFYDSLTLLAVPEFKREASLLDVGAGAGFPSVPLKLASPELRVTILDSLQKRIAFLEHLHAELEMQDFSAVHGRAEDYGRQPDWRDSFDQVTARAVARLPVLLEFCLPFVKVGGHFFAMKGPEGQNEVKEAAKALQVLGGEVMDVRVLGIPEIEGTRTIITVKKTKPTPKAYPRKAGTPLKKPIL